MGKPAKIPKLPDENDKRRMLGSGYDPLGELVELRPEQAKASPSGKPKSQAAAMLALFEAHQGEAFRSLDDEPLFCMTEGGKRQTMTTSNVVKVLSLWRFKQTGRAQALTARSQEEVKNHLEALAESWPAASNLAATWRSMAARCISTLATRLGERCGLPAKDGTLSTVPRFASSAPVGCCRSLFPCIAATSRNSLIWSTYRTAQTERLPWLGW